MLTGKRSQTTSDSKAVLDRHWPDIEDIVEREPDGPWMRAVTESSIRAIDLT